MSRNIRRTTVLSFLFISIAFSSLATDLRTEPLREWISGARVKEISDRAYEPAVIDLLDSAKESIVMSMYIVMVLDKGPVRLLIKDLEEALDRGVTVEIYLNARPIHGVPMHPDIDRLLRPITEKGARIYRPASHILLHDKLIIVDNRFVVVGSTNWSVAALKHNFESSVMIDSPELAKAELIRLRNFPMEGHEDKEKPRPDRPKGLQPLPEGAVVSLSKELVADKKYFSAMVSRHSDRAMDTYLFLLAESSRLGLKEFFLPLEDMAVALGMSPALSDEALRQQVIKVLKILRDRYRLIEIDFKFGKDAWARMQDPAGGTFNVNGDFFEPKRLLSMGQPAKYVFLINAYLESEGGSIRAYRVEDLCKRFGMGERAFRRGLKEIESAKEMPNE